MDRLAVVSGLGRGETKMKTSKLLRRFNYPCQSPAWRGGGTGANEGRTISITYVWNPNVKGMDGGVFDVPFRPFHRTISTRRMHKRCNESIFPPCRRVQMINWG
jgi:hypothetical protein